jgi:hypothetical protein
VKQYLYLQIRLLTRSVINQRNYFAFSESKGEVHPTNGHMKAQRESIVIALLFFLTSALRAGRWTTPRPGRFTPGKENRYPLYKKLSRPQGPPGRVRKISPPPGFDPRTFQAVASHYTDYAIPAPLFSACSLFRLRNQLETAFPENNDGFLQATALRIPSTS